MNSQHSPEPWFSEDDFVLCSNGESVGWISHGPSPLNVSREDQARIVACINACAGIPTDELHMIKIWRSAHRQMLYKEGG